MKKNKLTNRFSVLLAGAWTLVPWVVAAGEVRIPLEVPIAGRTVFAGEGGTTELLRDYIIEVYEFIVGGVALVAAVAIMYWGFRWVTAAGNQTIIGSAKEGIQSALMGLVIALTSYTILALINPSFVGLQAADVEPIRFSNVTEAVATSDFTAVDCEEKGTNFAQSLPANLRAHLNFSSGSSSPCTTGASYTALVTALTQLDDPNSPYYGMKLDISSAFRTSDVQQHLYSCYKARTSSSQCNSYVDSAGNTRTCTGCSTAAPDGGSSHQTGYALDVTWYPDTTLPAPNATYASLLGGRRNDPWHDACAVAKSCADGERESLEAFDQFMQSSGFKRICIEWWHFETTDSSGTWCAVGEYR
jgi:D-alanyl-D-alanine dipeptidase